MPTEPRADAVGVRDGWVWVERARIEALFRWLTDEGHMTPVATMQLRKLLDKEPRNDA